MAYYGQPNKSLITSCLLLNPRPEMSKPLPYSKVSLYSNPVEIDQLTEASVRRDPDSPENLPPAREITKGRYQRTWNMTKNQRLAMISAIFGLGRKPCFEWPGSGEPHRDGGSRATLELYDQSKRYQLGRGSRRTAASAGPLTNSQKVVDGLISTYIDLCHETENASSFHRNAFRAP